MRRPHKTVLNLNELKWEIHIRCEFPTFLCSDNCYKKNNFTYNEIEKQILV